MIRDVLTARLAQMTASGTTPDYQRLAREVLGIRGASRDFARVLVAQALVVEDRRDHWRRIGERVCEEAPRVSGVYIFRGADDRALYVGKAANLRRRLQAHFANRRWRTVHPAVARVARVEWQTTGSELEAILREATLIAELKPPANVKIGQPALQTRAVPAALVRDTVLLLPSIDPQSVDVVAARDRGDVLLLRADRRGNALTETAGVLWEFFRRVTVESAASSQLALAPLVFSWMAGRGRHVTRIDPHDSASVAGMAARLGALFSDTSLFTERLLHV
jgi:predicted GIY-YIG superfamily endonuclease